jgi:asparagine synthase (glutamine-hydrolysing)
LPVRFRLRGREGKYLLKKAMEPRLPREILYRDKMGFAVPLANWFRGPLRESARHRLLECALTETGFFDMRFVKRLLDEHAGGLSDHSAAIWALLMFESFLTNVHLKSSAGKPGRRSTGRNARGSTSPILSS